MRGRKATLLPARPCLWVKNQLHAKAGSPGKQTLAHSPFFYHKEHGPPHEGGTTKNVLKSQAAASGRVASAPPSPVLGPSPCPCHLPEGRRGCCSRLVQDCVCRNWGSRLAPHPLPSWPLLPSGHQTANPVPVSPGHLE